jgi:hypothetical protein
MYIRLLAYLFFFGVISAIEPPFFLFNYQKESILYDAGKNWDMISTFRNSIYNIDKKAIIKANDTLVNDFKIGSILDSKYNYELFSYFSIKHKNIHSYLHPRLVSNTKAFDRYTGSVQERNRLGFESGETDLSGLSFLGDNYYLNIGRGRESWGAGENIYLALSDESPSYDYLKFIYDQKKLRFIYFHGFLENTNEYNRYILGKGFEFSNNKDLVVSLAEIVIYSGINRPLDFSFLNPISSHLEIEQNNRQNYIGTENANAVWQISFDKMLFDRIRFSNNLIIDELVFDSQQIDSGKVNGIGWSSRISYNLFSSNAICNIYASILSIGTHTMRHGIGFNNFVQRGLPLGWINGSDGYELKFGCKILKTNDFISWVELSDTNIGEQSIKYHPYQEYSDYKKTSFPSGNFKSMSSILISFMWKYNSKKTIILNGKYLFGKNDVEDFAINFQYIYQLFHNN